MQVCTGYQLAFIYPADNQVQYSTQYMSSYLVSNKTYVQIFGILP